MRAELAAALTGASLLVWTAAASAAERITVGVSSLPAGQGNPYTTGGFPGIDLYSAMFDGLAELHEDGTLKPALAESWIAENPTTWVFTLRPGVTFANGVPFDAAAVEANYRILTSEQAQAWSMIREVRNIAAVTARDALTIEVRTRTPDLMTPARFAALKMVEPGAWAARGAEGFAKQPVGTGPYAVTRWAAQQVEMAESPNAWRKPHVPALMVRAVPETSARLAGVQGGALDVALNLGPEDIAALEAFGGRMHVYPQSGVMGMSYILVKDTPLSDPRVRRAVTYAVNRQAIVDQVFAGRAKVASQAAPSPAFGHDPDLKPFPYDPDRARALLAEAGYPDGFSFTVDVMIVNSTDSPLWQQVAADLAKVGVRMTVNVMPFARYNQGLYQGAWTGAAFGMNYGSLPALDPMVGFQYHSCLWLKPWICDAEQANLIKAIMAEFDRDRRQEMTRRLQRMTADPPIGLFLYEVTRFDGLGPRVTAYRSPFGYTSYRDIAVKDD
ncbi:MAG: ABC transporter substrate-binding protein [Rhodospirillaceae bacterium]|nr:ABC transporter substrate-binding protein [Rhodospirillaceae bacterium]